ncbi:MAG: hypothetical protein IT340_07735 [Chloroflexi bacterium]|nr:hypothetical protein [Chloroflexota bacterium]
MATIWSHEQVDDYCLDTSIRHIAAARPLLDRSATGFQIDLVLHSVSAYRFHFTHLLSDRRLGQLAKASLTESRYIDQESGEIFMFDEPFPEAVPDDVA